MSCSLWGFCHANTSTAISADPSADPSVGPHSWSATYSVSHPQTPLLGHIGGTLPTVSPLGHIVGALPTASGPQTLGHIVGALPTVSGLQTSPSGHIVEAPLTVSGSQTLLWGHIFGAQPADFGSSAPRTPRERSLRRTRSPSLPLPPGLVARGVWAPSRKLRR